LTLDASGTLTETGTGVIDAAGLTGSSVGGATLTGANDITDLDAFTNATSGNFDLTNAATLTVAGNVGSTAEVILTTTGAAHNLALEKTLTAATFADLVSAGTIAESGAGLIDANLLEGSTVGTASFGGANDLARTGTFSTGGGAFSLVDDAALTIASSINTGAGTLYITTGTGDALAVDSVLETTGTMTLVSGANVTESTSTGTVKADTLNVTAQTGIDLGSTLNDITTVGTDHTTSGPNTIDKS
jgi:hypothetical protein